MYSLNPCYSASKTSWCCNDQGEHSCCGTSGGSFAFNLTSLGLPAQESTSSTTGKNSTGSGTGTCNAVSCPVGKGAVIGGSVGSFFAGTIIAGLLGLYLAERRLRKQSQKARSNTASHVGAKTEWRTELQATQASVATPAPRRIGMVPPKYEMEGREVFESS